MIRRISIYVSVLAFLIVVILGFVNHLNWFTIFIRGFIAFGIFYCLMLVLGMIGIQAVLHEEIRKKHKFTEENKRSQNEIKPE